MHHKPLKMPYGRNGDILLVRLARFDDLAGEYFLGSTYRGYHSMLFLHGGVFEPYAVTTSPTDRYLYVGGVDEVWSVEMYFERLKKSYSVSQIAVVYRVDPTPLTTERLYKAFLAWHAYPKSGYNYLENISHGWMRLNTNHGKKSRSVVCSVSVAQILAEAGLIDRATPYHTTIPRDIMDLNFGQSTEYAVKIFYDSKKHTFRGQLAWLVRKFGAA